MRFLRHIGDALVSPAAALFAVALCAIILVQGQLQFLHNGPTINAYVPAVLSNLYVVIILMPIFWIGYWIAVVGPQARREVLLRRGSRLHWLGHNIITRAIPATLAGLLITFVVAVLFGLALPFDPSGDAVAKLAAETLTQLVTLFACGIAASTVLSTLLLLSESAVPLALGAAIMVLVPLAAPQIALIAQIPALALFEVSRPVLQSHPTQSFAEAIGVLVLLTVVAMATLRIKDRGLKRPSLVQSLAVLSFLVVAVHICVLANQTAREGRTFVDALQGAFFGVGTGGLDFLSYFSLTLITYASAFVAMMYFERDLEPRLPYLLLRRRGVSWWILGWLFRFVTLTIALFVVFLLLAAFSFISARDISAYTLGADFGGILFQLVINGTLQSAFALLVSLVAYWTSSSTAAPLIALAALAVLGPFNITVAPYIPSALNSLGLTAAGGISTELVCLSLLLWIAAGVGGWIAVSHRWPVSR